MRGWLTGWKAIADYMGMHSETAKYYALRDGMPIKRTPAGRPVSTPELLDDWVARQPAWKTKKAEKRGNGEGNHNREDKGDLPREVVGCKNLEKRPRKKRAHQAP